MTKYWIVPKFVEEANSHLGFIYIILIGIGEKQNTRCETEANR